jgi:prepilin signal peptidase PulO-like enzyme (type II secretory pathway)
MSSHILQELPLDIYLVLVALFVGSFINLAVDRAPRGESLVTPRSHCRSCGRVLNVIDLLPVAGYFIRRGRCATCGTPIGFSAPAIEASSGGLMLVSLVTFDSAHGWFIGVCLLIVLSLLAVGVSLVRDRARTASGR